MSPVVYQQASPRLECQTLVVTQAVWEDEATNETGSNPRCPFCSGDRVCGVSGTNGSAAPSNRQGTSSGLTQSPTEAYLAQLTDSQLASDYTVFSNPDLVKLGQKVCDRLSAGYRVTQVLESLLSVDQSYLSPKDFAFLLGDAAATLCPEHHAEVQAFADTPTYGASATTTPAASSTSIPTPVVPSSGVGQEGSGSSATTPTTTDVQPVQSPAATSSTTSTTLTDGLDAAQVKFYQDVMNQIPAAVSPGTTEYGLGQQATMISAYVTSLGTQTAYNSDANEIASTSYPSITLLEAQTLVSLSIEDVCPANINDIPPGDPGAP